MAKEWKCKDCCYFETDACPYLYMEECYYKSCNSLVVDHNKAYQQGRADKYQEIVSEYMLLTEKQVAEIKADAIDEFANRIKEYSGEHYLDCDGYGCQKELVFRTEDFLDEILEQLKEQN